ncbi:myeloperoxidase-like [Lissotriton helveticus]
MKGVCRFFGCLLIIAQLTAPGCSVQGKQTHVSHASNPKYIHCTPQTSVKSCPPQDVYRNINGACNNRARPTLGVSDTAYARWLPAEYEDGVSLPQGWTEGKLYNGHPLPLVRDVSNKIVSCLNRPESADEERSQVFMEWGQFITHDTVFSQLGFLDCGPPKNSGDPCIKGEPENSFPIMLPPDDPTTEKRGRKCMLFTRIAPACASETEAREPANIVSSFLDASAVYGSHDCYAQMLRDNTNNLGLLAVNKRFKDGSHDFLPFVGDTADTCGPTVFCFRKDSCELTNTTYNIPCFTPGDRRGNQNLPYMTINTIFLREHNRLARELKKLNPHWNGEKIYQEARKIVAALMQVITYRDYIPLVLGDWMDIELPPYKRYNEDVDPRISTVYIIAFRFAHTSIAPYMFRLDSKYKPYGPDFKIPFHQTIFATWRLVKEGGIDPLLRGLLINYAKLMEHDTMMSDEVRERLFETPKRVGVDLASIDLQRERDFGLPKYNTWRRYCGLTEPHNLAELAAVLKNKELARKLLDLYKTPENIDLWIGGIAEPFVKNGRVGPVFACLIGSQFRKIRDGDRFWWQNPGVFSQTQLSALSTATLARIFCDNSGLKEVPTDVFKNNEYPEDFVSCNDIKKFDLSAWMEGRRIEEKQHTEL